MEEERAPPGDYGDQYDDLQHGEYLHAEPEQQLNEEAGYEGEEPSVPPHEEEPQPPTDCPHTEDPNVVSLCWVAHCVSTNFSYFFLYLSGILFDINLCHKFKLLMIKARVFPIPLTTTVPTI